MITKDEYLDLKIKYNEIAKILQQYKSYAIKCKTKGRVKVVFDLETKKENIELIFKNNGEFRYSELIDEIKIHFKTGDNKSKSLLTEMIIDGLIHKSEARGKYFKKIIQK